MDKLSVRNMVPAECTTLVSWLYKHAPVSKLNPIPFRKGQVKVWAVEDESGKVLCYVPIKMVWEHESLAPMPGISDLQMVRVCQAFTDFIKEEARRNNVGLVRIQPNDQRFESFLMSQGYTSDNRKQLVFDFNRDEVTTGN